PTLPRYLIPPTCDGYGLRLEGDLCGEESPGLAAVRAGAARDDPAEVGGIHHDFFTARAGAPAPAGRAGELQSVGLAVAAGPLGHHVCDEDAVMVGGEHRVSARCPSQVQAMLHGSRVRITSVT